MSRKKKQLENSKQGQNETLDSFRRQDGMYLYDT